MYNNSQSTRSEERKEDKPPYSRVFIVCSKQTQEEELRVPFEKYGEIEDMYMPVDRHTDEPKGIAYIKYSKTSSAAAAILSLQKQPIKINNKPIKVMVATNKYDLNSINDEKYKRLFIKVHTDVTEAEVIDHFSEFGHVDSVYLQRDKATDKCKGFAYVHYGNFYDAAKAFEGCDRKYKPVFATPKDELKRSRNSSEGTFALASHGDYCSSNSHQMKDTFELCSKIKDNIQWKDVKTIAVTCIPQVPQKCIEKLFNIVPGMVQCQYSVDNYSGHCKVIVTYENERYANYAIEKINNFQFPSGELISVKPNDSPLNKAANNLTNIVNNFKNSIETGSSDLLQLADAIAQASTLIKAATSGKLDRKDTQDIICSVSLPDPQPMANASSRVAQRCFIVCKPYPPPAKILQDAFCRFGDLIDVCTFPNKTFGFVKYASVRAAQEAIKTLHGVTLCGIHLKVLEADEKPSYDDDIKIDTDLTTYGYGKECKRIKFYNHDPATTHD